MMVKFSLILPIPHNQREEDMTACMKKWAKDKEKMREVDWESYHYLYGGLDVFQPYDGALVLGPGRDMSGKPGTAIRFVQHYLNWFNLSQGVIFSWADAGVYRGGSALITRDDVIWFDPEAMARAKARTENIALIGENQ